MTYLEFYNIRYYSAVAVTNLNDVERHIRLSRQECKISIPVKLSMPSNARGSVIITQTTKASANGSSDSNDSVGDSKMFEFPIDSVKTFHQSINFSTWFSFVAIEKPDDESTTKCFVFQSVDSQTCANVIERFKRATFNHADTNIDLQFSCTLDILEEDTKGYYVPVQRKNNVFQFREGLRKQFVIVITKLDTYLKVKIDKFIGILLSPGRHVSDTDMTVLLSMPDSFSAPSDNVCSFSAIFDPSSDDRFHVLNRTPAAGDAGIRQKIFFTVAVDFVLSYVNDPFVRIYFEAAADITAKQSSDKTLSSYLISLKQPKPLIELVHIPLTNLSDNVTRDTNMFSINGLIIQKYFNARQHLDKMTGIEETSGYDNIKDTAYIFDESLLEAWDKILNRPLSGEKQRTSAIKQLINNGVPSALRFPVYKLLISSYTCIRLSEDDVIPEYTIDDYQSLLLRSSNYAEIINRDLTRTFPANERFSSDDRELNGEHKEHGSDGEDENDINLLMQLKRICMAYSVKDEELGYPQGLTFIVGVFLHVMPEDDAFEALVNVMYKYNIRGLFLHNFYRLHVLFNELEKLLKIHCSDLSSHFTFIGVETHMYASAWFLTLFTSKFPFNFVFRVMDLFLFYGDSCLAAVALALLKHSKKDLLCRDFEGCLKYLRSNIVKQFKYNDTDVTTIVSSAASIIPSSKKRGQWLQDYLSSNENVENQVLKEKVSQQRLTIQRLQNENDYRHLEIDCAALEAAEMRKALDRQKECTARVELTHEEQSETLLLVKSSYDKLKTDVQRVDEELKAQNAINQNLQRRLLARENELEEHEKILVDCNSCRERVAAATVAFANRAGGDSDEGEYRNWEMELANTKAKLAIAQEQVEQLLIKNHQLQAEMNDKRGGTAAASANKWSLSSYLSNRK